MTDKRDALVERVAEELWQAESMRVVGTKRNVPWSESGAHQQWLPLADSAIDIVLEEAARVADKNAAEVARLRAALEDTLNKPRDADKTYAELFVEVCCEIRAALEERT